jgi:hypothetical protein
MDDEIGWTADGKSLIGWLSTDAKPANAKDEEFVVRMDMAGKITTITHGNKPKILSDGKHVIYSKGYWKWYMCDLDGKNEQLLGDGYEGFQHISPGPNGTEFIGTHYVNSDTREPPVLSVSEGADIKNWKPFPKGAGAIRWR